MECLLRFGILRRVLNTISRGVLQNIGVSAVFLGDHAQYSIFFGFLYFNNITTTFGTIVWKLIVPKIFRYYLRSFIVEMWMLLELSHSARDVGTNWMSSTL